MNILELHTSHCEYLRARAVESGAELVTCGGMAVSIRPDSS